MVLGKFCRDECFLALLNLRDEKLPLSIDLLEVSSEEDEAMHSEELGAQLKFH
jgi:hypothetical protein